MAANLLAFVPFMAVATPARADRTQDYFDQTLRNGVAGFTGTCLATAPDFEGISLAAGRAGFVNEDGMTRLPGSEARIELMPNQGGCSCITSIIAPDANATAVAVFQAVANAGPKILEDPDPSIAAVLDWPDGSNALMVQADLRGDFPMLVVTLWHDGVCPNG